MIPRILNPLSLLSIIVLATTAWGTELEKNQNIRPSSQMVGTIVAPLEQGKQALSAGDKIIVFLDQSQDLKPGDFLEIFQPVSPRDTDSKNPILNKVGIAIMIEKIEKKLMLCVIDNSLREVSVGDRVFFAPSKK